MKHEITGIPADSEEFKKRQQNIDAILVLSKLLELNMNATPDLVSTAQRKISNLIEKI